MKDSGPKLEGLGIRTSIWRAKPRREQQIDEIRWEFQRRRAGRFRLREIINFLSKNTDTEPKWWADALVNALKQRDVCLRNPRDFSDVKPYLAPGKPVPNMLRAYYDCVDADDVNCWLDAHPDWGVSFRFASRRRAEAPATVSAMAELPRQAGKRGKLTGEQRTAIVQRAKNGEAHQKLADEFGVTRQYVSRLVKEAARKTATWMPNAVTTQR